LFYIVNIFSLKYFYKYFLISLFRQRFCPILAIPSFATCRKGIPLPRCASCKHSTGKVKDDGVDVYEMSSSLIATLAPHAGRIIKAKDIFGLEAVLEVVLTIPHTKEGRRGQQAVDIGQN